jgi:hypothetical protein
MEAKMNLELQKIQVIPEILNNLVVGVSKGEYRIPQFQREYVWEKSKVIELFDSIYREWPIGTFFLWKAGREYNRLFRHSIDLNISPIQDDDDITFILDGQQRITSLYVTLMGLTIRSTNYGHICFDVKDQKFTHREPDNRRYIAVCDIWQGDIIKIANGVEKIYQGSLRRCYQILGTYPISIIKVRDIDLPSACKIFQRINQSGKRLDRFDLISAMTFNPDFDLRDKFKKDIIARLKKKAFGEISPAVVTQLMALVKKGACTERVEYSLTSEEIISMWVLVVDSIMLAADTLRQSVGVQNASFLPYDAILTLLSYLYAKSEKKELSPRELGWVKRWFWRASFSQYYGSGGATKIGRDKELFDRLIAGDIPVFEPAMNITAETLVSTKMTWSRSAVRNAFLCLLAQRGPVHLVNNQGLDLVNGGISDFTNPEKHHIFPQVFLDDQSLGEVAVHALPNFCFLPAELNKRISNNKPSIYIPQLKKENSEFVNAAQKHLLPIGDDAGLAKNNYLQFLKKRSELIIREIELLTGISTAPPEDQQHRIIKKLETSLRNLIHGTLLDAHGPDYWKGAIPQDVRLEAERRIEVELRKKPDHLPKDFASARDKLNFCNPPDYLKLIVNKSNWQYFEPVFHRKADVEQHIVAFSEFRNAIVHNRPLTEIGRRAGELALVWLETVMPAENDESAELEEEQNDV